MACPMLHRKAIQLGKIGAKEDGVGARRKILKRAVPPDRHINLPPNHLFLNAQRHLPHHFSIQTILKALVTVALCEPENGRQGDREVSGVAGRPLALTRRRFERVSENEDNEESEQSGREMERRRQAIFARKQVFPVYFNNEKTSCNDYPYTTL